MEKFMLPCLNKYLFGIECFGCGLQRSLLLMIKGDFYAAFLMYPAIYFIIPLAISLLVNHFYKFKYAVSLINNLSIATVIAIFINFIVKQIIY